MSLRAAVRSLPLFGLFCVDSVAFLARAWNWAGRIPWFYLLMQGVMKLFAWC